MAVRDDLIDLVRRLPEERIDDAMYRLQELIQAGGESQLDRKGECELGLPSRRRPLVRASPAGLMALSGVIGAPVGGDALADSEALYDEA